MTGSERKSYNIEKLLANAVQPCRPLNPDEWAKLRAEVRAKRGRLDQMPINVASAFDPPIVYDGVHRLLAAQEYGRRQITADEIRFNPKIRSREQAEAEGWRVNDARRHHTGEDRANTAWRWTVELHMSQGRIAKEMGISQQAISELMRKYPRPASEIPALIMGADGKYHPAMTPRPQPEPEPEEDHIPERKPYLWANGGTCQTQLKRTLAMLDRNIPLADMLDVVDRDNLVADLGRLRELCDEHIGVLTAHITAQDNR